MWYEYRQNNSGGSFVQNDSVDVLVLIEAESAKKADQVAQEVGIYFDGCDDGRDCPCCGDRWYSSEWGGEGTEEPMYYSTKIPLEEGAKFDSPSYLGESTIHLYHANGTHLKVMIKEDRVDKIR